MKKAQMASFQKNVARCNEKKECLKSKVVPTVLQTTLIVKKCNLIDPNCLECSEDNKYCTKCKNNLYLYQNKCYEITNGFTVNKRFRNCRSYMSGCISWISEKVCTKCDYDWVLEYGTNNCRRPAALVKKYFYDSKDNTYKKCDYKIEYCQYCKNSDICYRCNTGYHTIENGKDEYDHSRCFSNSDLPNKYAFYTKNSTHRTLCSSKFDGCQTCNTVM